MPSDTRHASDSSPLWDDGLLAPLSLAAYVTWAAVVLQVVGWERLPGGDPREWGGVAALAGFLVLFLLRTRIDQLCAGQGRLPGLLALAQAAVAVLASWLLESGATAILLIIAAAQLAGTYPMRVALAWLLAFNLILGWVWLQGLGWPRVLLALVPVMGFQAFAVMTAHYAVRAQRSRDELAQVNAELLATRELLDQSARSEERLRLSRELHDVAGHKLTALKLNLARLSRDPALASREEVATADALASELLGDIRAVVGELRKHDGIDLRDSLQALARPIPDGRISLELDPGLRAGSVQVAETVLRCAQEAITNALRHGRAARISVRCSRDGDDLVLDVNDDGGPVARIVDGHGLTGMRERLAAIDGRLDVRPRATGGVHLTARIPAGA